MTKLSATVAKRDFYNIIRSAIKKHQLYHIHHADGDVVVMSEEEYESLIETLELLSIPGFRESIKKSVEQIKKGETISFDEVFGDKWCRIKYGSQKKL